MLSMDIQTGKHHYFLYKTRAVSDKLMHVLQLSENYRSRIFQK